LISLQKIFGMIFLFVIIYLVKLFPLLDIRFVSDTPLVEIQRESHW